jgi:hypothetical protein
MSKSGTPTNCVIDIYASTGQDGTPTGSLLGEANVGTLTTGEAVVTSVFNSPISLSNNSYYCFVWKGTCDTSNYFSCYGKTYNNYTPGKTYYSNDSGSTWNAYASDCKFSIYSSENNQTWVQIK